MILLFSSLVERIERLPSFKFPPNNPSIASMQGPQMRAFRVSFCTQS